VSFEDNSKTPVNPMTATFFGRDPTTAEMDNETGSERNSP
jgi:hypothetical protein